MEKSVGILYIVATPIGNLGDITQRAAEILGSVDMIAAEDTRHSSVLLGRLGIKKPLISYYKERENSRAEEIIDKLKSGLNIALISDAGTPCVSDPGAVLVRRAHEENINVFPIPGACAAAAAFSVSGLVGGYVFLGFLPDKKKSRTELLSAFKGTKLPLVFYSAPHDVNENLSFLYGELGERRVYIMREMTKIHEEFRSGDLASLRFENPKGEFVLIIDGAPEKTADNDLTAEAELAAYIEQGMPPKDAIKTTAKNRKLEKDVIYKIYLQTHKTPPSD
ncbi:MAG: 16S rRNA (cytidine(1402)-2'-O)-methyltransferase [Clostridiales bacterium]|jgi:16S rRNA (cytidine1402-2'-O)-methyltransferase|nr:16S rRNA (cytidine(1402)-2'-O)-methyltransferase [Clostridiales bacterium]